ncbi:outer membrane beta-barrel protein [Desulfobulbus sp.]|uniref:outer membrane protein n=1 Tax=Desulfobulbus sp. TaxID=895 RepID=UPI00286EBCE1|nr:outer membrane beta-barrel protein [Desulfobulbus sp.]
MKKVLSVMAASAFVLTAGVALAGGPGKKMGPGCPEACQKQIDDLQSSQAQQNEQLSAHGKQLQNHETRITDLEKAFADAWYVRLGVRASWMQQDITGMGNVNFANEVDSDAGFGGAIAFGREFAMYQALGKFRAEVELAKQGADLDDASYVGANGNVLTMGGDLDVTTVFLNGYYELPVYDAFSVYFMAGVGYAKYDLDVDFNGINRPFLSGSDNVFAYKAGAGITYNFTDQIAGDLGYEYLGVADTDIADSINGHNVVASVRFKF